MQLDDEPLLEKDPTQPQEFGVGSDLQRGAAEICDLY